MAQLFLAVVKDENDNIVFEHIANYSDDTIYGDICDVDGKVVITGNWNKWYHVVNELNKVRPNWKIISYNAGTIPVEWLINVLKRPNP